MRQIHNKGCQIIGILISNTNIWGYDEIQF